VYLVHVFDLYVGESKGNKPVPLSSTYLPIHRSSIIPPLYAILSY